MGKEDRSAGEGEGWCGMRGERQLLWVLGKVRK